MSELRDIMMIVACVLLSIKYFVWIVERLADWEWLTDHLVRLVERRVHKSDGTDCPCHEPREGK